MIPVTLNANILVTGASGFIGSHVTGAALAKGHAVTAAVRDRSNMPRLAALADVDRLTVADGYSMGSEEALEKLVGTKDFGAIVHAASNASHNAGLSVDALLHDSVSDVIAICKAAIAFGIPRVVLFGSAIAYGPSTQMHVESEPLVPAQPYGLAKTIVAQIADYFGRQGLAVVELRPFNVYGPGDLPPRLVPYCIECALNGKPAELAGGEQARDFVHVTDLANAALAGANGLLPSGAYNVATGVATPVIEVARMIFEAAGVKPVLKTKTAATRMDTHQILCGSPDKLAGYGVAPQIKLAEGLSQTVAAARVKALAT